MTLERVERPHVEDRAPRPQAAAPVVAVAADRAAVHDRQVLKRQRAGRRAAGDVTPRDEEEPGRKIQGPRQHGPVALDGQVAGDGGEIVRAEPVVGDRILAGRAEIVRAGGQLDRIRPAECVQVEDGAGQALGVARRHGDRRQHLAALKDLQPGAEPRLRTT